MRKYIKRFWIWYYTREIENLTEDIKYKKQVRADYQRKLVEIKKSL